MEKTLDKFMMATKAIHKCGDISRDEPELCRIYAEDGENWFGSWVEGFGFFDVKFPKETTRELTDDEINHFKKQNLYIGGANIGKVF